MRTALLIFTLIVLCCTCYVQAQDNDVYSGYGIDNGLPQSSIWSIVQDKNGFLWAGTSDGAGRFDGYNFTVYRNDPRDSSTVPGGNYLQFYTDSSGRLWVISENGISLYNAIKDNFKTVFSYRKHYASESFNYIFGEDKQYLWAGISTYGLLKIDKQTFKVTAITNTAYQKPSPFVSWQNGFVDGGKVWITSTGAGCYVYDAQTGILNKPDIPPVFAMVDFNATEVIAATIAGFILINKHDLSYKSIPFALPISKNDLVKVMYKLSDAEIMLGCGDGLFYVDSRTWKLKKTVRSFSQSKKHSFANVQSLYKDRSGNMWIGTNGDGLKKLMAPHKKFRLYSSYNDSSNLVKTVYADKQHLYVGYFGNGLEIFDREGGAVKNVQLKTASHALTHIYALTAIDSNQLLLNMADENVAYHYNLLQHKLTPLSPLIKKIFPGYRDVLNNNPFFLNTGDKVYTGLGDQLLYHDVSASPHITAAIAHRFTGEMLTCAYQDSKGTIWVGSINGVFYLEDNEHKKIALPEFVHVKTINEDADGNTWIGTIKGIYILDKHKKLIQHYTEDNGLSNRFVYGILRDDAGNMWFSHNKGLTVYKTQSKTFRHYTKEDGLQSNEFNTGAYFKAGDGMLFFGGINGTNGFNPAEILDNPNMPSVKITGVHVFDKPMKTDSAYWSINNITLQYNQNSLSFEFAGLEFTNPGQNQYAFMMEGIDEDWIYAGDKRFTRYAGIPPGKYRFKVKASNNDGIWQTTPAVINIHIIPPFWQRLWFRIACMLLFVSCTVAVIVWVQKQRYKKRMRTIELQQNIQTERERISRDLHDNVGTQLSLISNNIEWLERPLKILSETEKTEKLHFVNETARGIIATLRETIWALNKEQISIEEFSDKMKAYAQKQLAMYPSTRLNFVENIANPVILGPSEALDLFRICQEALANALKYADATCITFDIQADNKGYKISIADNGKGFDMHGVDHALQNGLENMKYRAQEINSTLEITTATNKGTAITITKNSADAV